MRAASGVVVRVKSAPCAEPSYLKQYIHLVDAELPSFPLSLLMKNLCSSPEKGTKVMMLAVRTLPLFWGLASKISVISK